MRIVSTRSLQFAAYLLACGLRFVGARRLNKPQFRASFAFEDPALEIARLRHEFTEDVVLQRFITSRAALGRVLDIVYERDRCGPAEVADMLTRIGHRAETSG